MFSKSAILSFSCLVFLQNSSAFTPPPNSFQPNVRSTLHSYSENGMNQDSSPPKDLSRRDIFSRSLNKILVTSVALSPLTANAAVLQSGPCASGEGEACANLAEGNEFILSLQKKSSLNREKNEREALLAYNMKNYPDFFASLSPPKFMVMNTDGKTFQVFTEGELSELKQAGKVVTQMPKTMGGKVTDVTQKPYLVFKE